MGLSLSVDRHHTHFSLLALCQSSSMPILSDKLISTLKKVSSPQRPFASQRGGQRKSNLKCFSTILESLSGDDKVSLLRAFFSSREGRPLLEQLGLESTDTSQ